MKIRKIYAVVFIFLLSIYLILFTSFKTSSLAQTKNNKQEEPAWKSKLYAEEIKYQNFSCRKEDSQIVAEFFKERPPKSFLPICHNDCPIVSCRPVVPFPALAKAIKVTGTVSVHILVNEAGKVLYARVLDGHALLQAAAQKGACETQFRPYQFGKHQGIMHFTVDDYDFLGVPNTANQVW